MIPTHNFDDDVNDQQLPVHIRNISQKMGIKEKYIKDCADLHIAGSDLIDEYCHIYECKTSKYDSDTTCCYELVGNDPTKRYGNCKSWLPATTCYDDVVKYVNRIRPTNESLSEVEAEPAGHLLSYLIDCNSSHYLYYLDQLRLYAWANLSQYKIVKTHSKRSKTSKQIWYAYCAIIPLAEIEQFQVSE